MSLAFNEVVTLTGINCGECGGTYAINERYRQNKWETGGSWHCPYCQCGWGYRNDNENARLKKQIEARERELREEKCRVLNEIRRREESDNEKARIERKLKRVDRGVCPCCNRTFQNLQRHMATKHPKQ